MRLHALPLACILLTSLGISCETSAAPKDETVDLAPFATYQIFPKGSSYSKIRATAAATEPPIEFALPNRPLAKVSLQPGDKLSLILEPDRVIRGKDFADTLDILENDRLHALYFRGIGVSNRVLTKLERFKDMKWLGLDCVNLDTQHLARSFPLLERLELICIDTGAPEGAFPGDAFLDQAITSFKQMRNLQGLRWGNFQIDIQGYKELATMDQLISLELWPLTPMDDKQVETIASMKNLVELELQVGPKCTPEAIFSLQRIKTLKHLTIRTTDFKDGTALQLFRSTITNHNWNEVDFKSF